MQLDDLHVTRADAGLLVDLLRRLLGHVVADQLDHARRIERRGPVRGHRLADDLDQVGEPLPPGVVGRDDHRGRGAAGRRTALIAGERAVDVR